MRIKIVLIDQIGLIIQIQQILPKIIKKSKPPLPILHHDSDSAPTKSNFSNILAAQRFRLHPLISNGRSSETAKAHRG
eukprot:TRINITY_DN770_c0_g1_i1.p1 TRINITY_DN770_c0_g1~~TRINITY_DN770_c0_g1_i1.p1  ORF type:complete len:78 (+),score=11.31 TRINITY_DN770_c0_g1_i1:429-662(+)